MNETGTSGLTDKDSTLKKGGSSIERDRGKGKKGNG